jgi:hypothetical protein
LPGTPRRLFATPTFSLVALARGAAIACVVLGGSVAPARAADRSAVYETQLLSRAADGGFPNGPTRNAVISQDGRVARTVAYESDASNLVAGDGNGLTDVFAVSRAQPYGDDGSLWRNGPTRLVSRGLGGAPANGRSYGPSVSGDASSAPGSAETPPRCVAFVSEASNLVPGDTNGRADAFVWWIDSGRLARISVDSRGRQADGSSYDVAVDGDCTRVAFTSDATNLAQTTSGGARNPNYRLLRTGASAPAVKQVYVRVIAAARKSDRGLVGLTYLASASNRGVPGDGDSFDPSWSLRTDQVLAFTSRASNLDARDGNGVDDVYVSAAERRMRSFGSGRKRRTLDPRVRLVSVNPATGRAGNGPSSEGVASDQSCSVVFTTQATDVVPGDAGPTADVARADIRGFLLRRRILRVDPPGCRAIGDGPAPRGDAIRVTGVARGSGASGQPEVAGGGDYVVFASAGDGFPGVTQSQRDANGVQDAFLWSGKRNVIRLQSATSADQGNRQLTLPSTNPFPSQRINYVLFETADPFADLDLVSRVRPAWLSARDATLAAAQTDPAFHQVYLRYLGGVNPAG